MAYNSQKILNFPTQQSPVNLSEKRYNKPHCILPIEDMRWVMNQSKTTQQLWTECWAVDPYGSRFVPFTTALAERTFRLARKVLYDAGLFEFKPEKDTSDTRKTTGWLIINLHGARRIAEFWNKTDEPRNSTENVYPISGQPAITEVAQFLPPISQPMPIEGTVLPIEGTVLPIGGTVLPRISSETLANTGVSSPLSIFSGSSQELLKGVHEKKTEDQAQPEALGGLPAACEEKEGAGMEETIRKLRSKGTAIADALAAKMERLMKRFTGNEDEADRDFYAEQFKQVSRWDIPADKLRQFLALEKDLRIGFFENFKTTYKKKYEGYLFGCRDCFNECMEWLESNRENIVLNIRSKREHSDQFWANYDERIAQLAST